MAHVIFFEKPGCGGNARQKALLAASGHQVEARSLLAEPWSAAELRLYFGKRPIEQWFNQASPRVKSGEIDPQSLAEQEALVLMLADPLLIRRPLMRVGERREAGFDQALVEAWIGLTPGGRTVTDTCIRSAAQD
jgi:nitrogenase-associated protein